MIDVTYSTSRTGSARSRGDIDRDVPLLGLWKQLYDWGAGEPKACGVAAGVEVESRLVPGRPADALIEVAKEFGASAIVVGTVGESPITGALLGSLVLRLVQRSSIPVLVVPAVEG